MTPSQKIPRDFVDYCREAELGRHTEWHVDIRVSQGDAEAQCITAQVTRLVQRHRTRLLRNLRRLSCSKYLLG